jgi:hypothetical protein
MALFDFDFLQLGKDVFGAASDFVQDLDFEDIAAIATTGVAVSSFFSDPVQPTPQGTVKTSADSLKEGAEIVSSFSEPAELEFGADDDRTATNRQATADQLRVRRATGSGFNTGLEVNPLGISL